MSQPFILKNAKQKLTRQLNALNSLLKEAREFEEPWNFPFNAQELETFLISKGMIVKNLMFKLEQRWSDISDYYAECNQSINDLTQEVKVDIEKEFDDYWSDRRGEELLHQAEEIKRKLEKRLVELQCQEASIRQELKREREQRFLDQPQLSQTAMQQPPVTHSRLLGNELKIPNFYGNPSDFDSFWELFEELVHKQPYSNIEKLSILINCCKGDAARSLQMVPRTGESYEKAISQLKNQYQDPRRITIQMIRKLKSMKQCQDDHRSLRNNLSDIQAIIATLEKQGEAVNTTNMRTMILETFSKSIQEEMAKKEFDSGSLWSMKDLLDNLSTAIRRREHVDGIREPYQNERSIFHTNTTVLSKLHCTGCGQQHRFQHCNKYPDTTQKIERLRELNACWKCFSLKHRTAFCRKQNCFYCSGPHSYIICRQRQRRLPEAHSNVIHRRTLSPFQRQINHRALYERKRSQSPGKPFKSQSYSPNRQTSRNRHFTSNRRNQSSPRSSPRPLSRRPFNQSTFKHSPSPSRTPERQVRFSQSPQTRRRSGENVTVNFQIQNSQVADQFNNEFTAAFASSTNVRLMVVPVYLQSCKSHEKEVVLALLDSASDQSFISTSLVRRMSFKIQNESTIVVNTFGGKAEKRKSKRVVTCLYNAEGDGMEVELLTNDQLTPPLQVGSILPQDEIFIQDHFPSNEAQRLLHGVCGTVVPEILIGMDYFNAIMKLHEPVIRLPSGLFLTPTIFGPVLSGVAHKECEQSENDHVCRVVHTCTALDSSKTDMDISELWKLNSIGIEDMSSEEEINNKIVADFYSTVQIKDNKIFVRFPWKSNKNRLANNYNLALSRLHQLFKMKERNPHCWKEYCGIIEQQLEKNFIEDAPRFQIANSTPCYYIPHQAVIKSESATTKTRIVLDASSKMKGELSLNDVIYQGPLILPNLCGVLLRSRIGSKILIADVEKAFHMIHLQESERDAVRFLWLRNVDQPPTPNNLRILRFCRIPFGINASPFLLGISIKLGIEQQSIPDKDFQRQLNDNLYVDNVLLTDDSTQSLIDKYRMAKKLFNNMTMNLRQFISSDDNCNKAIDPADLSTAKSSKILGIPWDYQKDSFSIKCKLKPSPTLTKRKALQLAHSTFDPLGLLIPLLLPAKLFLQDLWKHNYKWDEVLPPDLKEEWQTICDNAAEFEVSVPRAITCFAMNNRYELLTFVDASARSFAAATYLRTIGVNGVTRSSLLIARQRLAPINKNAKTVTIPRLELLALLIGVRLTNFALQEMHLSIKEVHIFSDSQVTLNWVQSNTRNGTFVINRRQEIRSKIQNWSDSGITCHLHYIPSEMNPADCATKGLTKNQFKTHTWWTGPAFILKENSKWPELPEFSWTSVEHKGDKDSGLKELSHTVLAIKSDIECQPLLFPREYSSLPKYKRVLSLVMKFLKFKIFNKVSTTNKEVLKKAIPELERIAADTPLATLTAADLLTAETLLIKSAQKTLTQEKLTKLSNLQLYRDENGLIRCRGRIHAKHLARETQEPILLPEAHNFTSLLVKDIHTRCGHQGVNGTLANLRLNYWLPKGRQIVKKLLKSCLVCKKWNSKPFFYPDSPPLPHSRTEPSRPFLHVGIDLAGPFQVLSSENGETKRWILLLTCMVTRAVHLEIVNSLSAIDFLNGLRRFIARRGKPVLIISDNATNFTLGCEIIARLSDRTEVATHTIQTFLSNERIQWKFITPLSPWKGGFYERMIGVVKSILKKIARKKVMQENEFITVVPECEAMVNTRPLTYSGSTVEDSVIIRPIDFIIPNADVNLLPSVYQNEPDQEYFPTISTKEQAIQRFQNQLSYLQHLWTFWTNTYLLELRNFHQTRIKQKSFTRKQPYTGEVVLIMEENTPRGEWPLGLVTKLIQDHDGTVRSVELKTAKSNITRSINFLIPLEVEEEKLFQNKINESESTINQQSVEAKQESDNDGRAADGEVTAPQSDRTVTRTRPWLPRRAKEKKDYRVNSVQTHNANLNGRRLKTYCQRWLMLTLLTSLCASVQSRRNTESDEGVVQCTKGGIIIKTRQQQDRIYVCANDYCLEVENPDQVTQIQFPAEITLHSYHVLVKTLLLNSTQAFHWACSPSPFCEQITCTFCTPMVTNPECWPRVAIVLAVALFYIVLVTVYLMVRTMTRICRACKSAWNKVGIVKSLCARRLIRRKPSTEDIPLIEIDSKPHGRWKTSTFIRLIAICAIASTALGCQQVIVVPSTFNHCNAGDHHCTNISTIVVKFNSMQSELCLQIKHKSSQAHLMKITAEEVVLRCQKESLYFTQDTETRVQSSKRCPHRGSCTGLKCAGISTDTLVEELDIANNFTGITYCTESCGGWGCSCGFPSSGCLFYRIYHVPTGNDVHEVFQCSSWYETVKLKLEQLDTKQIQRTFTGEIKPYEERTFGNTKVEVTNVALSPNTIQYKRFISNNRTTAYLDDDVTFSYACTSNPAIFNTPTQCSIRDTCKCNPAEDSILCYCAQNNISQVYHLSHMLPLPIPNGIIVAGPNRIPKIHTKSFSIELAIKLDSTVLQIQREAIEFKCNVAATALSGCYNCYKGAVATIDCSADTPRATAQATCGHQQFVLTCTREGKENQIRLFFNKARVREQCRVRCGTQTTILEIYGTLNYINGMRPFWKYTKLWNNSTQADQDSFTIEWEFPDIAHFIDVCRSFYIYTVVVLISLPAAAFIVASYLCAAKTTTTRTASTASTLPFLLVPAFVLCSLFKISQRIVRFFLYLPVRLCSSLLRHRSTTILQKSY